VPDFNAEQLSALEQELAARGGRERGDEITFRCPKHDDEHPSATYNRSKRVWYCHVCGAGGGFVDLAKLLGVWVERAPARMSPARGSRREIVATYDYVDEAGVLLLQVVRYRPKDFRVRRPDGEGGWISNAGEVRDVLFNLPDVVAVASLGWRVYVVEGEKDALAVNDLGLCATTNRGGAGKFRAHHAEPLAGADVVILADRDEPGRRHAAEVAGLCLGRAKSVRVLELPGEHGKDAADWIAGGGTREELERLADATAVLEPPPREDPAVLLDEVVRFIERFVVLGTHELSAIALWILHTHAFAAADATPYLHIGSPEKRSGKTRLLEVLELFVAKPWSTARVSAAALMRKIDAEQPTLLLDEVDAALGASEEYAEAFRGVANAGHRRGGKATVCIGQGSKIEARDFAVFCPKAIAGIGKLPDTIADRSIAIILRRRSAAEFVERFRARAVQATAAPLRDRLARWGAADRDDLRAAEPQIPDSLQDRAADAWEPLLAIADRAGEAWSERARTAAVELSNAREDVDGSKGALLLAGVRRVFTDNAVDRLTTTQLIEGLVADDEAPWSEWRKGGKPISPPGVAKLLKPFGIHSRTVRVKDTLAKGYVRESFEDAWARYLPGSRPLPGFSSDTTTQDTPDGLETPISDPTQEASVSDREMASDPHEQGFVSLLRLKTRGMSAKSHRGWYEGADGRRHWIRAATEEELDRRLADARRASAQPLSFGWEIT
jgi:hypothetical protein